MKRRNFIIQAAAGSLLGGIDPDNPARGNSAHAAPLKAVEDSPLVTIAASNEQELRNPAPLDGELSYEQVRDIVRLALDRDVSSRNLRNIVKKDSWVVIKTNIVRVVWLSQEGYYGRPGLAPDFERDEDGSPRGEGPRGIPHREGRSAPYHHCGRTRGVV